MAIPVSEYRYLLEVKGHLGTYRKGELIIYDGRSYDIEEIGPRIAHLVDMSTKETRFLTYPEYPDVRILTERVYSKGVDTNLVMYYEGERYVLGDRLFYEGRAFIVSNIQVGGVYLEGVGTSWRMYLATGDTHRLYVMEEGVTEILTGEQVHSNLQKEGW